MIRAIIRLQDCTTNRRRAFVSRGQEAHGIAAGEIHYYQVVMLSWPAIRNLLQVRGIIGSTYVNASTVQFSEADGGDRDCGETGCARCWAPALTRLSQDEIKPEWRHGYVAEVASA